MTRGAYSPGWVTKSPYERDRMPNPSLPKLLSDLAALLAAVGATRQASGLRELAVLIPDTKAAKALLKSMEADYGRG